MPKFQRKPIQIAMTTYYSPDTANSYTRIIAVCDDGTVWDLKTSKQDYQQFWSPLPDIPQDGLD